MTEDKNTGTEELPDGPYEYLWRSGEGRLTGSHKDGKRVGLWEEFEHEQLVSQETYVNGDLHGPFETFYTNGRLKERGNYKKGVLEGIWETYYDNGVLRTRGTNKNRDYDSHGDVYFLPKPIEGEGLRGPFESYHENGKLCCKHDCDEEELWSGLHETFFESGILARRQTFKDGFPFGPFEIYYESGQLMVSGVALRDGRHVGPYESFHESGELCSKHVYEDGELWSGVHKSFDKNGAISSEYTYKGGMLHGECVSYYDDGTVMERTRYENDLPHGLQEYFDADGLLKERFLHVSGNWEGAQEWYEQAGKLSERKIVKDGKTTVHEWYHENGQLKQRWQCRERNESTQSVQKKSESWLVEKFDMQGQLTEKYEEKGSPSFDLPF